MFTLRTVQYVSWQKMRKNGVHIKELSVRKRSRRGGVGAKERSLSSQALSAQLIANAPIIQRWREIVNVIAGAKAGAIIE